MEHAGRVAREGDRVNVRTRRCRLSGGVALTYRDHPGGAVPVLALHGLASNARWWDLVALSLARSHRLVAMDQRGHGRSARPKDGYTLVAAAADAGGLLKALALQPVVVVGHSWGAWVALELARAQPDRVLGVVCVDGALPRSGPLGAAGWADARAMMTPPELRGVTETQVRAWAASGPLAQSTDAETAGDILLANFRSDGAGGLRPRLALRHHMELARALFHTDTPGLLAAVTQPVTMVVAQQGHNRRTAATEVLASLGTRGELVWVDGGHDLPMQRPQAVADAVRAMCQRAASA